MRAPFQRLLYTAGKGATASKLVGASGGSLSVFDATTGGILSRWRGHLDEDENERPLKKRKTGKDGLPTEKRTSSQSPKTGPGRENGVAQQQVNGNSFITNLIATSNGQKLVATTAADKLLYVFDLHHDGTLSQISGRYG